MSDYARPLSESLEIRAGEGCESAGEVSGDQETARSETQPHTPQQVTARGRRRKKSAVPSILLLCFSLGALLFALRTGVLPGIVAEKITLASPLLPFRAGATRSADRPVSSYLPLTSREALALEAFSVLDRKKRELLLMEREREELEKEKNSFVSEMDERKDVLAKKASIFDIEYGEDAKGLFKTSFRKRIDLYLKQYEKKKAVLQGEQERLKGEIKELTGYLSELGKARDFPSSPELGLFFQREAEQRLLKQLFFLIERREYGRAIVTLEKLVSLDQKGRNRLQSDLLRETLKLLREEQERAGTFQRGTLLNDLKMAYLREDYGKALALSERLDAGGYMLPVLAEFRGALERNIRLSEEASSDLGMNENLKGLSHRALSFEKKGEYEKALKIYQDLLIFNLPVGDREYLMGKIQSLTRTIARRDAKREENTKASTYLETARRADQNEREKEALDNYRKIILECPNSDYVGEALTRLIALSKASGM